MPDNPLPLFHATIRPEWVDYNGHMSEAFYVLIFGNATDAFYDHVGLDDAFRRQENISVYTLEAHIRYLSEGHEGDTLAVETRLLACDARSLRLHHRMQRDSDGETLAITEIFAMHIDKASMRTMPFHDAPRERLAAILQEQASLPPPKPALSRQWSAAVQKA